MNGKFFFRTFVALLCICGLFPTLDSQAQSLDPRAPAPLQSGINVATADSTVGSQYWYFHAEPGPFKLICTFKSFGVLGNPFRMSLAVTVSNEPQTGSIRKVVSSEKTPETISFDGKFDKPTKVIVRIDPLSTGPLKQGGDYQIEVTGAAKFGKNTSTRDPIIGTYVSDDKICKFLPDGTVTRADGSNGTWKCEDSQAHVYTIVIGDDHYSEIHAPGRGLVDAAHQELTVFKQLH